MSKSPVKNSDNGVDIDVVEFFNSGNCENVTGRDFAEPEFKECEHAAHCMFYADWNVICEKYYYSKAAVFMQMRFDGHLGFPGGLSDDDETPLTTANREVVEETGFKPGQIEIKESDLICEHLTNWRDSKLITHFYGKKITYDQFTDLERSTLNCSNYGNEVMGIIRPPLYTKKDGYKGFPSFLNNQFIGNVKDQLLIGLYKTKILTFSELKEAVDSAKANLKSF